MRTLGNYGPVQARDDINVLAQKAPERAVRLTDYVARLEMIAEQHEPVPTAPRQTGGEDA